MSVAVSSWVWKHSPAGGTSLLVLLALADWSDDFGENAYPSIRTLAKKARISERQVVRVLRDLEASGQLKIQRRDAKPSRRVDALAADSRQLVNRYTVVMGVDFDALGGSDASVTTTDGEGDDADDTTLNGAGSDTGGTEVVTSRASGSDIQGQNPGLLPHTLKRQVDPSEETSSLRLRPMSPKALVDVWNAHSGTLPKVQVASASRTKAAAARLMAVRKHFAVKAGSIDAGVLNALESEFWLDLVKRIAASPAHNGSNAKAWTANFDYLVRQETWVRFIEQTGWFDKRGGNAGPAVHRDPQNANDARKAVRADGVSRVSQREFYTPEGGNS